LNYIFQDISLPRNIASEKIDFYESGQSVLYLA